MQTQSLVLRNLACALLLLGVSPLLGPRAPIESLLLVDHGCTADQYWRGPRCTAEQYWDDVDQVCVPNGQLTEIDGHSMEEISKVLDEHRSELHAIRGVFGSGIDRHGIFCEAIPGDNGGIPRSVGGLPVHLKPATVRVAM